MLALSLDREYILAIVFVLVVSDKAYENNSEPCNYPTHDKKIKLHILRSSEFIKALGLFANELTIKKNFYSLSYKSKREITVK